MSTHISAWLGSQLLVMGLCAAQVKTSEALIKNGQRELAESQFLLRRTHSEKQRTGIRIP